MDRILVETPPSLLPTAASCIGFLILLSYVFTSLTKPSKGRQLPPGPKPKPIIGNLLDMPRKNAKVEEYWTRHRELYGPISSLSMFGNNMIILNDADIARDLLDKRGLKYSARPTMEMAGTLMGLNEGMVLTQPGDRFREMRKVAHTQLGSTTAVSRWGKEIDIEVRRYLLRTLERPEAFQDHIRREAGTIILKIMYGYQVDPHKDDPLVDLAEQVMDDFTKAAVPGEWLVDLIPALKYVPGWMPGAGFRKTAAIWNERLLKMANVPYEFTKKQFLQGIAPRSVISETLSKNGSITATDDDTIKWAGVSMYAGGADTTVAQMEMFFLAMLLFPDVVRKAQEEVDTVVGDSRLPDESDRENMPYLDALLKEMIRWEPIGEFVIPHSATEDDTYGDFFIPKGAIMLAHIYGMYHDPKIHSDPMDFKPERFLGPNPEPNPFDLIWGFGRRLCPGRHLAVWNLWLQMSRTLAVFNIKPVDGKPPVRDFTTGVVRRPLPFAADITVRSAQHERLIRTVADEAPLPAEGDAKLLEIRT